MSHSTISPERHDAGINNKYKKCSSERVKPENGIGFTILKISHKVSNKSSYPD
jgi:hypothetical protein